MLRLRLAALPLVFVPCVALAQSAPGGRGMRLEYQPAAGVAAACPGEEVFRQMVGVFAAGDDPFRADSQEGVRVKLERIGISYRATVARIGADGAQHGATEEHTRRTCPEAAREAASTVFLLVAPRPVPAGEEAGSGRTSEAPAPAQPSTPPADAARPKRRAAAWQAITDCGTAAEPAPCPLPPPPRWPMDVTIGLGTYVMMTAYLTADVGPGFALAADVRGEIISVGVEARVVLPGRVFAREPVDPTMPHFQREFDISQYTALVVPCARWKYLVGCAVLQGGFFYVDTGVDRIALASFGIGPRVGFEVPFAERFAVFGFAEALFTPAAPAYQFVYVNPDFPDVPAGNSRWEQPVGSAFFGAGVSVKFK